ncbi:MAG: PAS domain S-box protein [Verrucomicrobiota bacterium]
MNPSFRVLHLEDNLRDAEIIRERLEADGLACVITLVSDRQSFELAFNQAAFDVILCDYNLPDYDGLSALKLAREKQPNAPVIILSGLLGEEEAVKCLHRGATDYLLKERLDRLPSAVKRALEEAEEHRKRQQAEAALRKSEEHLRAVLQYAHDAIISTDSNGRIVSWNNGAQIIFGYAAEEVRNEPLTTLMPERYREAHQAGMRRYLSTGKSHVLDRTVEMHGRRKDGSEFPFELSLSTWSSAKGQFFTGILRDITERKQAAAALAESEDRFRQLAEQSNDGFWFVAPNPERVLYVSPAVEKLWGLPAERFYQDTRAWLTAIHPDDQPRVHAAWQAFLNGQSSRIEEEYRVVRPDGSVRWVLDTGMPIRNEAGEIIRLSGITRNITERKQNERQMLRTQRLESIGTLAGGVAHDLNNTLAPILMATQLLRMQYPDETKMIDTIESSAKRGADMVRQLLTFAKGVEGERLLLQPRHLLKEMEKLIHGTFPKNIELRTSYAKDLWTILGDATQLHQVLLNLCVNARDAMPKGGTLTLKAENREIDTLCASAVPGAKPGSYVVWRVEDTGTGIPPEVLDRIFEPFFTTKGLDKGTGLGLSTVLGIVKSHGGFVRLYSEPDKGTTFAVYLLASDQNAAATAPLEAATSFRGNGETVLVVDDEAAVRQVTRTVLTALNFRVLTAADGTEALIQVAEKRAELRAVITDLDMPYMDGRTFVRALKRMLPEVGIIVASGRLEEREENEFKTMGVSALLNKPFTQEKLVEALKTVFQKVSSRAPVALA